MPRPFGSTVALADDTRDQLEALVRARSTPQALALHCHIVLRAAQDDRPSNQDIAAALGCDRHTVGQWRERFVARGLQGLRGLPRSGRPRSFSPLPMQRRRRPGDQPDAGACPARQAAAAGPSLVRPRPATV